MPHPIITSRVVSSSAIATNGYSGCEKPILVACAATPCFLAVPPPAVLRRVKGQETAATTGRQRVFLERQINQLFSREKRYTRFCGRPPHSKLIDKPPEKAQSLSRVTAPCLHTPLQSVVFSPRPTATPPHTSLSRQKEWAMPSHGVPACLPCR